MLNQGKHPQHARFAAETTEAHTLAGCVVMPGSELESSYLISKTDLTERFQNHAEWNTMARLVRD